MKECYKPNYNYEGVDLNIYTVKKHDDIEYYSERLDFLRESKENYYNMVTTMIEMFCMIDHDVKDEKNYERNYTIRQLSKMRDEKFLKVISRILNAYSFEKLTKEMKRRK